MTAIIGGTTGVTFPDASTQNTAATGFGFKNRIINGAMMIDQRNAGASQTLTAGASAYTLDRWKAYGTGANFTVQRVAGSGQFQYAARITGASSNTLIQYYTRIESLNCYDLAGQTVTLSCTLKASTNTTCVVYFDYATATDNFASTTAITNTTFNVTTTATQFTKTFAVPSSPGSPRCSLRNVAEAE